MIRFHWRGRSDGVVLDVSRLTGDPLRFLALGDAELRFCEPSFNFALRSGDREDIRTVLVANSCN